jgi:hypothetical protein
MYLSIYIDISRYRRIEIYRMYRYKSMYGPSRIDRVVTWGLFLGIKRLEHEANNSAAILCIGRE